MEPTIEAPKNEAPKPEDQAKALLEELEKLGVSDPEQIQNMAKASSETGRLANHLGTTRQENEALRRELEGLRTAIESQRTPQNYEGYGDETVNLGALVEEKATKAIKNFYMENIIKPQQEMQKRYYQEYAEIVEDDDYPLVGEEFQKHIGDPRTAQRLQSGQTTLSKEYNKMIRATLRGLVTRSAETLKGFTKQDIPHTESASQTTSNPPTSDEDYQEEIQKAHEARMKGMKNSNDALQDIVNSVLFKEQK